MNPDIRAARASDGARINEIYNHTIVDSHISFDTEPWDTERREGWWKHYAGTGRHRVFVADLNGIVVGTACSSQFREKIDASFESVTAAQARWTPSARTTSSSVVRSRRPMPTARNSGSTTTVVSTDER